jgi:DNA ligase-1
MLDRLQQFVERSNSTNSNTDKLNVLKDYQTDQEVLQALRYVYSPFKQYYVTSKNLKKRSDLVSPIGNQYGSIFTLLDTLNDRIITGHDAIAAVNRFILENRQYEDLIYNIFDRNLKTRSTTSMINKVVPGLVPTFDVALAATYDEKTKKKVNLDSDEWYLSRKLDGVRCLAFFDNFGTVTFKSRSGKPFDTLGNVAKELEGLKLYNIVMDGEICIVDENGDEDFQSIIKEIKRKDHTIENPLFQIFDMISLEDFENKTSREKLSERLDNLQMSIDHVYTPMVPPTYFRVLEQDLLTSWDMFESKMEFSVQSGWEGLMLRKDDKYQGKRSTDILKVKKFYDEEYIVVDLENSPNRVIVNGLEVEEMMLKNVIIEHKGNRVQVGSGFTIDERRNYFENPNKILGKTITVQYFEETTNQNGTHSLRFPVIKAVYQNGRVDYV